jgi:hypothetical protein
MKRKLFEQRSKNSFKLVKENSPIVIDRHGSMSNRPTDVRFKKPDDYNNHMGFDAALPDDVSVPPEQIETVQKLIRQGYKITGHTKMPDDPKQVEILMTRKIGTRSEYADVAPNGKVM